MQSEITADVKESLAALHHLAAVNIMKESGSAKPGQTTVAWQTLAVRRPTSDALQTEMPCLECDLCC